MDDLANTGPVTTSLVERGHDGANAGAKEATPCHVDGAHVWFGQGRRVAVAQVFQEGAIGTRIGQGLSEELQAASDVVSRINCSWIRWCLSIHIAPIKTSSDRQNIMLRFSIPDGYRGHGDVLGLHVEVERAVSAVAADAGAGDTRSAKRVLPLTAEPR
jgi:hypothetical protein